MTVGPGRFFRVVKLEKWQQMTGPRARWLKLSLDFFDDPVILGLPDSQRLAFIGVLILSVKRSNLVPFASTYIKKRCNLRATPDLDLFLAQGLIEIASSEEKRDRPPRGEEIERRVEETPLPPAPREPAAAPPRERKFTLLDGDRVKVETTANPPGFDRDWLVSEGWTLIREIMALTGEEPTLVLKRCSQIPGSTYFLYPHQFAGARPEHLMRTVDRMREELAGHQARANASTGISESVRSRILTPEQAEERLRERRKAEREAEHGRAAVGGSGSAGAPAQGPGEGTRGKGAARGDPGAGEDAGAAQERAPPSERAGVERADAGAAGAGRSDHGGREGRRAWRR